MTRVAHEARAPVLVEAASAGGGGRPVAAGAQRGARGGERALLGTGESARHRKVLKASRLEGPGPGVPLPQFTQPGRAARRHVRAVETLDLAVGVPHVVGRCVDAVDRAGIARAVLARAFDAAVDRASIACAVLKEDVHGPTRRHRHIVGVAPRARKLRRHRRRGRDQRLEPWKFSRVPERSRGQARERSGVARHKLARVQQRRSRYLVVQRGRGRVRRRLRSPRVAEIRTILPEPRRGRGTDSTVHVGPKCGIDGRVRAQKRCREHPGPL
mmetsp:Transcript_25687/g.72224  ORF Transcript_25687/g.72224 Transcript_25687/m.72224 type:complete len:271 (+) Transcript_25687:502-1314(+)